MQNRKMSSDDALKCIKDNQPQPQQEKQPGVQAGEFTTSLNLNSAISLTMTSKDSMMKDINDNISLLNEQMSRNDETGNGCGQGGGSFERLSVTFAQPPSSALNNHAPPSEIIREESKESKLEDDESSEQASYSLNDSSLERVQTPNRQAAQKAGARRESSQFSPEKCDSGNIGKQLFEQSSKPSPSNQNMQRQSTIQRQVTINKTAQNLSEKQMFARKLAQFSNQNQLGSKTQGAMGYQAMLAAEEKQYQAPMALDLFAMETRAKRTIGELVKPIVTQADEDRQEVAMLNSRHKRIEDRLDQLEYTLELNSCKPKVFQLIEEEIADLKSKIAVNDNDSQYRDKVIDQKIESITREMQSCLSEIKSIESLTRMRDKETAESNQAQLEMKTKFSLEVQKLEHQLTDNMQSFGRKIQIFEQQQELNNGRIKDFDAYIKEIQKLVKETYETTTTHSVQIQRLTGGKVEQKEFNVTRDDLKEQLETIRFATYDNFRVARATDNYIEKYLPFTMQTLISRNMASIFKNQHGPIKKTKSKQHQKEHKILTKEEEQMQKNYEEFKHIEYQIYKDCHRVALNDDGIPKLKKTSFRMPGYRQILSEAKEQEYTIDNEKIYQNCYEKRQKKVQEKIHRIQKSELTSDIMQDIMPVNELSASAVSSSNDSRSSQIVQPQIYLAKVQQSSDEYKVSEENDHDEQSDDDEEQKILAFENPRLSQDQDRIDDRQVRNIYKMMNQGNVEAEKRREASPFLNYAIDGFNVTLAEEDESFNDNKKESTSSNQSLKIDNKMVIIENSMQNSTTGGHQNVKTEVTPKKRHENSSDLKRIAAGLSAEKTTKAAAVKKTKTNILMQDQQQKKSSKLPSKMTKKTGSEMPPHLRNNMISEKSSSSLQTDQVNLDDVQSTVEFYNQKKNRQINQIKLDEISNLNQAEVNFRRSDAAQIEGATYHERRKRTHYLVGMEDLEPILSDLINKAHQMAQQAQDCHAELQKEMTEHKAHIEQMTNNSDMPLLKPIKAIIDEQITAMYTFQNEIKLDMERQDKRCAQQDILVENIQDRVRKIYMQFAQFGKNTNFINTLNDFEQRQVVAVQKRELSPPQQNHDQSALAEHLQQFQQLEKTDNQHRQSNNYLNTNTSSELKISAQGKQSSKNKRQRNLTQLTNRTAQQQVVQQKNQEVNLSKDFEQPTVMTEELIAEALKLQNILNFEIQKKLKMVNEDSDKALSKADVHRISPQLINDQWLEIIQQNQQKSQTGQIEGEVRANVGASRRVSETSLSQQVFSGHHQPTNIEVKKRPKKQDSNSASKTTQQNHLNKRVSDGELTWETVQQQQIAGEFSITTPNNAGEATANHLQRKSGFGQIIEGGFNLTAANMVATDKNKSNYSPHLSDGTTTPGLFQSGAMQQHPTIVKNEINLWESQQMQQKNGPVEDNNPQFGSRIDCNLLISMLEQMRLHFEQAAQLKHQQTQLKKRGMSLGGTVAEMTRQPTAQTASAFVLDQEEELDQQLTIDNGIQNNQHHQFNHTIDFSNNQLQNSNSQAIGDTVDNNLFAIPVKTLTFNQNRQNNQRQRPQSGSYRKSSTRSGNTIGVIQTKSGAGLLTQRGSTAARYTQQQQVISQQSNQAAVQGGGNQRYQHINQHRRTLTMQTPLMAQQQNATFQVKNANADDESLQTTKTHSLHQSVYRRINPVTAQKSGGGVKGGNATGRSVGASGVKNSTTANTVVRGVQLLGSATGARVSSIPSSTMNTTSRHVDSSVTLKGSLVHLHHQNQNQLQMLQNNQNNTISSSSTNIQKQQNQAMHNAI